MLTKTKIKFKKYNTNCKLYLNLYLLTPKRSTNQMVCLVLSSNVLIVQTLIDELLPTMGSIDLMSQVEILDEGTEHLYVDQQGMDHKKS